MANIVSFGGRECRFRDGMWMGEDAELVKFLNEATKDVDVPATGGFWSDGQTALAVAQEYRGDVIELDPLPADPPAGEVY